uniref:NADH-ubiquinone oxidoreductase chain 3 n=1 Tax=Stegobium paniceum TaxID=295656 RepID=A0A343C0X5_STEPN|nr:NADH dehydrogenase subunit 3 [Stegobium paniceum]ARH10876.1 NADH dehydrogenase subunit 3 [Stegobium paniceum]QCI56375.1 NADH dehydrogenase subunit 3 [Stegobium paniceum]QDH12153.1 NADH dehydrogenase subunit 3 [Stegobium paniceum]
MLLLTLFSFIVMFIIMLIMTINNTISKKTFKDREKLSPFECGFDPKSSTRITFSLHFFLIAIIFLIFDIEIALILPMIYVMKTSSLLSFSMFFMYFIFILLIGVYHEWNQGMLTWTS